MLVPTNFAINLVAHSDKYSLLELKPVNGAQVGVYVPGDVDAFVLEGIVTGKRFRSLAYLAWALFLLFIFFYLPGEKLKA